MAWLPTRHVGLASQRHKLSEPRSPRWTVGTLAETGPADSAQVEVPSGGHERLDRLRRDACHALDAVGCAVVTIVPGQPGHGGDVLFRVWRQAHSGEPPLPPVQRHAYIKNRTKTPPEQ